MMEPVEFEKHGAKGIGSSKKRDILNFIKQFDLYTKIDENYRVQTNYGAIFTVLGWILILVLTFSEVNHYLNPPTKEHMVVDTTLGQKLSININISFHALTCGEVHLDAMDIAGDNQLNIEQNMFKQRLTRDGQLIGKQEQEIIGERDQVEDPNYCGSCYGAETEEVKCCNTCDALKNAYMLKGWNTLSIIKDAAQCLRDKSNPFYGLTPGEGCRVTGTMRVNKVAGNFHMTVGESIVRDGAHIHQFAPNEAPLFNISHTIHSISYGEAFPNMPPNPLDGVSRYIQQDPGTGLLQYFIRVIPTVYATYDSQHNPITEKMYTHQYVYTEKFRPLSVEFAQSGGFLLPGIFFVYDISPFLIEITYAEIPFFHLMTRLFAIVGGIYSIMGVLDAAMFQWDKLFKTHS